MPGLPAQQGREEHEPGQQHREIPCWKRAPRSARLRYEQQDCQCKEPHVRQVARTIFAAFGSAT